MFFKKILFIITYFIIIIISGCYSNLYSKKKLYKYTAPLGEVLEQDIIIKESHYLFKENIENNIKKDFYLLPDDISGVWKVTILNDNLVCQISTPKTKFGKGYRAWPLHCPYELNNISSWSIYYSKLIFYDKNEKIISYLNIIDKNKFNGKLASGIFFNISR